MLISVPPPCTLETVPLENIILDFEIEEAFFRSLAESVDKLGVVIQPVMLIENGDGKYRVYAGKRRILSAKKKGMPAISALVFAKGAPESLLNIYAIAENMNRGPNPADEAERILKVMSYTTGARKRRPGSYPCLSPTSGSGSSSPSSFPSSSTCSRRASWGEHGPSDRILPKENQKKLLREEKLTLDKIEKRCRSFKLDTLLGEDDLFDVPEIERDPLEEAKAKILSVVEASECDTTLLREAVMLIDRYRAKEGGK